VGFGRKESPQANPHRKYVNDTFLNTHLYCMSIERGSRLNRQVEVMTSASGIWNIAENQSSVRHYF